MIETEEHEAITTWKNQEDHPHNTYYFIDHLDFQKRWRVLSGQHMHDVLEDLKPSNYLTEFIRFMKGCDNLSRCYPLHEDLGYVDEIRRDFWSKYQMVVKLKIKPMIRKIYKIQIREDLMRLKMYGVL